MKSIKLFKEDVFRGIETVIKVDDQDHILQEVKEYVITNEISKKIREFFSSYKSFDNVNGVWISGFFGSGKSHLLKILSYTLENKEIEGEKIGELFSSKIKNDEILKGDIIESVKIKSESILFNIDQQSQITSKQQTNGILEVFYKVLYDHFGFYGRDPHIGDFELWLSKEGKYEIFKKTFKSITDKEWEVGRIDWINPIINDGVEESCSRIFGLDVSKYEDILDKYDENQKYSVLDFANKVDEYIQSKDKGFRLNFFVDEVGQFISNNTKLMLNLQTIGETLNSVCKGHSWILVTSQEDLNLAIGDDNKVQTNDFSKIQERFKIRISLTSSNVDEVVEKRLLDKRDEGINYLKSVYQSEHSNIDTIISFSEIGIQFKGFIDEKDFINKYPFIPYQFDLFQQCIRSLSRHNAFLGKHSSVGERSMLGVFQEVLKRTNDRGDKFIVPFDELFEGIRSTIKGEIQNSITLSERNISDKFSVRVLKSLFLVKYYDSFKTNFRNVSVLLIDSLDVDLKEHEKNVQQSLNLLEQQSYIQRNGELYEFLTDTEKDIEELIKSTHIDSGDVTKFIGERIFDSIIGESKLKYNETKQDFRYSRKVDGSLLSRDEELVVEIISPENDNYESDDILKSHTMGIPLLRFKLSNDSLLIQDIRLYLKTNKYIKQNSSGSNKGDVQRILHERSLQNQQRVKKLETLLERLLGESKVFLNGEEFIDFMSDGKSKVIKYFQNLIKVTYTNLKLLGNQTYDENKLKSIIHLPLDDLFNDSSTISPSESEVLSFILRRKNENDRTSLTDLKDHFSKNSYGWPEMGLFCILGYLIKRSKVELKRETKILDNDESLESLLNNRMYYNTLVYPQEEISSNKIKITKDVYRDFFNETISSNDPKVIGNLFKEKSKSELQKIYNIQLLSSEYPFVKDLNPLVVLLKEISEMDYFHIINETKSFEDELLGLKEDVYDPIFKFTNGNQGEIYKEIQLFIQKGQPNFKFIKNDTDQIELINLSKNEKPYIGNIIKRGKELIMSCKKSLLDEINFEKEKVIKFIDKKMDELKNENSFLKLEDINKSKFLKEIEDRKNDVIDTPYIGNLKSMINDIDRGFIDILNEIQKFLEKEGDSRKHFIKQSNVKLNFYKSELETEEDIDNFISEYKKVLVDYIKKNTIIKL